MVEKLTIEGKNAFQMPVCPIIDRILPAQKLCYSKIILMTEQIDPKKIRMADYSYELPAEKIAQHPLPKRDNSKLLVYKNREIQEDQYANLADYLPDTTLLLFNNTRVVPARLYMQTQQAQAIEVFCLEPGPGYADITTAMSQQGRVIWLCLLGGAKKWKEGTLSLANTSGDGAFSISASKLEKRDTAFLLELTWQPARASFAEMLSQAGELPLPPYLNRATSPDDYERYQTIYAQHQGSVAAPTAGLHFTPELLDTLDKKSIAKSFITLHVGAGTFMPVKSETPETHAMHREYLEVSLDFLTQLRNHLPQPIVPVGTTSMRTLESIYWMGKKLIEKPNILPGELQVNQWDPYEAGEKNLPPSDALDALIHWMKQHQLTQLMATTQLLIAPSYRFQFTSGLITNFHQPGSTLLLLVGALVGDDWKKIYEYALNHSFRFLSYGDGSLLWKTENR
jgi:S-adenosylmethionine:tRNA ribosyltransferase-isomerase